MSDEKTADGRCPTTSGSFRCDRRAGHAGECVTRQRVDAWVGPAATLPDVVRAAFAFRSKKDASPR